MAPREIRTPPCFIGNHKSSIPYILPLAVHNLRPTQGFLLSLKTRTPFPSVTCFVGRVLLRFSYVRPILDCEASRERSRPVLIPPSSPAKLCCLLSELPSGASTYGNERMGPTVRIRKGTVNCAAVQTLAGASKEAIPPAMGPPTSLVWPGTLGHKVGGITPLLVQHSSC
jgi:hypothetical protein